MKKEVDLIKLFSQFCDEWKKEFNCGDDCEICCPLFAFIQGVYKQIYKGINMKDSVRQYMTKSIPPRIKKDILQRALARQLRVKLIDIQERWESLKEKLKEQGQ